MELEILNTLNEIKSLIKTNTTIKWLDMKEASRQTSLSISTLRRAMLSGDLKYSNVTGKILFKVEDISSWLNG
jgi:hypothetical protein